jgi:hypothetical protein
MYKNTDKRKIYHLIDAYLSGDIDESTFCNEFHCSYDLELDYDTLTEEECKAFSELGEVAGRFSEFEGDHKKYPGVYYTKSELRQKIMQTKEKLSKRPD